MAKECPRCRAICSEVALACDCGHTFRDQALLPSAKSFSTRAAPPESRVAHQTGPKLPNGHEPSRALDELELLALGHIPARGTRGKSGLNTEQRRIANWTCTAVAGLLAVMSVTSLVPFGFIAAIVAFVLGRIVWAGRSSLPGSLD